MIENPAIAAEVLEGMLENSEEGTLLLHAIRDANNEIVDFEVLLGSKAAKQIINKPEADLVGKRLLEIFTGHKTAALYGKYKQVVETGERYTEELYHDFSGQGKWIKLCVSRFKDGVLLNFSDISEFKSTILENRRSHNLYSALVKYLPGVEMALIDREYSIVILDGNPFRTLVSGRKVEKDDNLLHVLAKEETKKLKPMLRSCFKGSSIRKEIAQGEKLFRISFVPIKEEYGNFSHVLFISEDISIFRSPQNELRNKIYALESANESLEQFAYVASHDLQEPLRKIQAFGDRLNSKYAEQLEGSGQDYLERMQNAAARMRILINDLLKYSRVGRFREPFQPVNIKNMIEDITSDLEAAIGDSEAKVIVNDLPTVEGEPSQLRQLFQNLISNAIKFQKPDVPPEIVISSTLVAEPALEDLVISENSGPYYKISVTDNGIGFDVKYLDRIFNIFQRLHGRSEYRGTGIGLAICRKIVENHGGAITASSKPGEGATFYVVLPENQTTEL